MVRRGQAAQSRVERGQVSRVRHELTGAPLALPRTRKPSQLRRQRPQEQIKEIPRAVLEFQPDHPLNVDRKIFHDLSSRCSVRCFLDDQETVSMLFAAEDFAGSQVPPVVWRNLTLATMTAPSRSGNSLRSIAVCTVDRAGVDCVGHVVRVATELNPNWTILSIDGLGAFDHVYRASMLENWSKFTVSATAHSSATAHVWAAEVEGRHTLEQHEGGGQGDPSCLCCSVWAYKTPVTKSGVCVVFTRANPHHLQFAGRDTGNALASRCTPARCALGISQVNGPQSGKSRTRRLESP